MRLIQFLKIAEINAFLGSETKRKNIIKDVQDSFSNIESYLILKYPERFIFSKENK